MAEKDVTIKQRNSANDGWDTMFPETRAENVFFTDSTTGAKYKLGITNGLLFYEEVTE